MSRNSERIAKKARKHRTVSEYVEVEALARAMYDDWLQGGMPPHWNLAPWRRLARLTFNRQGYTVREMDGAS